MVTTTGSPGATEPKAHSTSWSLTAHVPDVVVTEAGTMSAGSGSLMVAPLAREGPLLTTVSV